MLVHWNTFLFWCQWRSICSDETVVLPKTTKVGKHCSRQHQQTHMADNKVKNASVFQLAFNIQQNCMRLLKKKNTHTSTHAQRHALTASGNLWLWHSTCPCYWLCYCCSASIKTSVSLLIHPESTWLSLSESGLMYSLSSLTPTQIIHVSLATTPHSSTSKAYLTGPKQPLEIWLCIWMLCKESERIHVVERHTNVNKHLCSPSRCLFECTC